MRLRATFAKQGALRWTGHLDLHRIWERSIRRAGLPLAYSQGFHPQPKIQLAAALPLGFLGSQEVVDFWLVETVQTPLPEMLERLRVAVPPGILIHELREVAPHGPALQTRVIAAEYEALLLDPQDPAALSARVDAVLASGSLPRERRGKAYDLRPLIEALEARGPDDAGRLSLFMRLTAREGATGRPEEVLDALGIPFEAARIRRLRLLFLPESVE